ncbi:MAG: hypothetical protein ACREWG_13535 [Gammaproteobacteria bacterium]
MSATSPSGSMPLSGAPRSNRGGRPYELAYLSTGELAERLSDPGQQFLGRIDYSEAPDRPLTSTAPTLCIPMGQPDASRCQEAWLSTAPVAYRNIGAVRAAHTGEVLLITARYDEPAGQPFERVVEHAFDEAFSACRQLGYPQGLRFWSFFGDINGEQEGLERYRRFSIGRRAAMARHGLSPERGLPAASAVGGTLDGLYIYAVAARGAGLAIENPRQWSASRYPAQYGPQSPWFSRAVLKDWGPEWHLYLSGTASIVGHESLHSGDPAAQLSEALRNVDALIENALPHGRLEARSLLDTSTCKLYVRDPSLLQRLCAGSITIGGRPLAPLILRAELCRPELLVEIEAVLRFARR